jgi:hypothetical protein
MFEKLIRAIFGEPSQAASNVRLHESGQLTIVSIHDLERQRMYERMAQHQRLIEVEEDLYDRF